MLRQERYGRERDGETRKADRPAAPREANLRLKQRGGAWVLLIGLGSPAVAQQPQPQPMGSVATKDARVTGGLEVTGEVARLMNNVSVTANDRAAPVALNRGGHVLVCSTSEFHLLHSGQSGALVFGLDRGAVEIYTGTLGQDVVLTPDLKLTPVTNGSYDLRVRVTREGDTCIDNAGLQAPVLNATDAFSSASYRILPGQHLLFVKGDLHQVVDHERSSCGCPSAIPNMIASTPAAAAHPFPQAQSEGLAPAEPSSNEGAPGTANSQVSTSFSYNDGRGTPPPGTPTAGGGTSSATEVGPAPAAKGGFFHSIGHFFHKLFHPNS